MIMWSSFLFIYWEMESKGMIQMCNSLVIFSSPFLNSDLRTIGKTQLKCCKVLMSLFNMINVFKEQFLALNTSPTATVLNKPWFKTTNHLLQRVSRSGKQISTQNLRSCLFSTLGECLKEDYILINLVQVHSLLQCDDWWVGKIHGNSLWRSS